MKIVILCGGERTGKSTLAECFKKAGYEYFHFNPPKGSSPYQEYRKFCDDVLMNPENCNRKFVIDRYMYCEFPYSKHFGRTTDMTYEKMNSIERDILKADKTAAVVYCENDIDKNWELIQQEGKNEFKSKDEVLELRKDYRQTLLHSTLALVKYDFTKGDNPEDIVEKIERK